MDSVYYNTFTARTEIAERLQNFRRERVTLDRIQPFAGFVKRVGKAYATIAQFIENERVEFQNWLDAQRACQPSTPFMAEC